MEPDLGKVSRVKLGEKARRELVRWAIGLGIVAVFMGVISAFGGFKPLPGRTASSNRESPKTSAAGASA